MPSRRFLPSLKDSTLWRCYRRGDKPLLVLHKQPEVYIYLKRVPRKGEFFRWNDARWQVSEIEAGFTDEYGPFTGIEAKKFSRNEFSECPECGCVLTCSETCFTQFHSREDIRLPRVQEAKKKPRPGTLDAPLRTVVVRKERSEMLECGHIVQYSAFKYIDVEATKRRCLECCPECPPRRPSRRPPRKK